MHLVLVHGGGFTSACWDPLLPHLRTPAIAVDLPGRGRRPADPATIRLADWVDALVDDVRALDDEVVLVGHSLAGITIPGAARRLPDTVRHLVFVACTTPPQGGNVVDQVVGDLGETAQRNVEAADVAPTGSLDVATARAAFCQDLDDETAMRLLAGMVPEAMGPITEPVDRSGLPPIGRTWVRTLQDRTVPPDHQLRQIEHLGGVDELIDLDVGHMAMVSAPAELAAILDRIAAAAAVAP